MGAQPSKVTRADEPATLSHGEHAESPATAGSAGGARQTRYRDVCGSVDELKRLLFEEPDRAAAEPQVLEALVEDMLYMLARMEQRLMEYEQFRAEVLEATAALRQIGGSRRAEALDLAPVLRAQLPHGTALTPTARDAAVASAEAIRDVAQDVENKMSRYKTLALAIEAAYRMVRGPRAWVLDEAEAEAAALPGEPEWARWLPPSPHRERILRHLRSGRAHLLTAEEMASLRGTGAPVDDGPPWVQFSDGGVMALPNVKWSDEIANFYSSETPPHPRARHYHEYADRRVQPLRAGY
jgi:hypothetical protein